MDESEAAYRATDDGEDGLRLHAPSMEKMTIAALDELEEKRDGEEGAKANEKATRTTDTVPRLQSEEQAKASSASVSEAVLSKKRMSDDEFKRIFVIPKYLREAMAAAVESQQIGYLEGGPLSSEGVNAPLRPLIVMINSKSGGRKGPALSALLHDLLSKEQVYDLATTPPKNFFRYGLGCLDRIAESGDRCAQETRNNLRVIVAGGDGTVGWVLGSIAELHAGHQSAIPSVGIIPLGTGNDLARSFGWGGSFPFSCRPIVKRYLIKAGSSETCKLDSWQVIVRTTSPSEIVVPHSLHPQQHIPLAVEGDSSSESSSDENASSFEGIFYNYFSIGMDAQVAYGFHHLRERAPYVTLGPVSNKLVYSGCSCVQGWFCTPCSANPRARGLRNVMRLHVRRSSSSNWEQVDLSPNIRAVVLLNLQSYASGRNPWGHPTQEYNIEKGFVDPRSDDGLLEVFGLFDGWHASCVLLGLRSAKRLAQGCAFRFELVADQRHRVYMQIDGEPWRQPLNEKENSTVLEINRVSTHSIMLKGS